VHANANGSHFHLEGRGCGTLHTCAGALGLSRYHSHFQGRDPKVLLLRYLLLTFIRAYRGTFDATGISRDRTGGRLDEANYTGCCRRTSGIAKA
jgi:hypothetical protein